MGVVDVDLSNGEYVLTRDEIVALLEREACARYHLSATEFVARVRAGTFDECGGAADLVGLARLLGADDPLGLGI